MIDSMTLPTALPSGVGRQQVSQVVAEVIRTGARIKTYTDNAVARLQQGNVSADDIFETLQLASKQIAHLTELAATPELDTVARQLIPGYTGTLSTDAMATAAALQATINWVIANVPNAQGYVLVYKWLPDGTQSSRTFTPAQTSGLATALSAVGATIG